MRGGGFWEERALGYPSMLRKSMGTKFNNCSLPPKREANRSLWKGNSQGIRESYQCESSSFIKL